MNIFNDAMNDICNFLKIDREAFDEKIKEENNGSFDENIENTKERFIKELEM